MDSVIKLKKILMEPLIRLILKHPKIMKSKLFVKAMTVFPDKISSRYDQKIAKMDIDYQAPLKEGLKFVHQAPEKALDIATGTGVAALLVAKHFENTRIEALDLSPEMIKIAKRKAKEAGHRNITFKIGNAMKLDYPGNEFDLIVTSNAPVYLGEAVRVLKPGGEILVAYSLWGEVFDRARKDVIRLLQNNGLEFRKLETAGEGVFILGRKEE